MGKIFIAFISMAWAFMTLMPMEARAGKDTRYSALVMRMKDAPSETIMKAAARYAAKGRDGEAVVLYSMVCSRLQDDMPDDEKNRCAKSRLEIGNLYYAKGGYAEALDEFTDGVKTSEMCRKPLYMARLYNNIGNVHCVFLDYEKGINYYLKAYECSHNRADRKTQYNILVNLAGTYVYVGDMAKARKYYALSEKKKDPRNPTETFLSGYLLSTLQIEEGRYGAAMGRLRQLASYAVAKNLEPKFRCFAFQELYSAYEKTGQPDSTLKYMLLCDATARRNNIQHTFASTLKQLSAYYEKHGNRAKADTYRKRYETITDSVYDVRRFDAVKNSLFNYEVGKTVKEIQELQTREHARLQTIRIQRIVMGAAIIVALATAAFLLTVWRQKRKLRRSYANLYMVNRDLVTAQETFTQRLRAAREEGRAEAAKAQTARQKDTEAGGDAPEAEPSKAAKYQASSLTEAKQQAMAEHIRAVMEETTDFCDSGFSLDVLADKVGSNRQYVSQVINNTFGKTFSNYVNPYRIHLACARIDDKAHYGNMTLKAIAESVGFKSYTTFVNVFRKETGITPLIYQQMSDAEAKAVHA